MKEGVYFHDKKGIALALKGKTGAGTNCWGIHKGKMKNHPWFRDVRINVYEELTGEYFWNKSLRNYEYIGEY